MKPRAVIKVGGDMLLNEEDRYGFAKNVLDLVKAGWDCLVLHGGGPQLNALQEAHGLVANKIDGRRITSEADLKVVKQALCGEVNVDLVRALLACGLNAFGCHGASGRIIEAKKRAPMSFPGHGLVDMGEVGDVEKINANLIENLFALNLVPVVASLGVNREGAVFNINADTTVTAIAAALNADLLILSTKVGGVFRDITDQSSRIAQITPLTAESLIADGVITDGMIPKIRESLALLDQGVASIAITNAAVKGGFLAISGGDNSIGTRIIADS